jgi:hypothetical protein
MRRCFSCTGILPRSRHDMKPHAHTIHTERVGLYASQHCSSSCSTCCAAVAASRRSVSKCAMAMAASASERACCCRAAGNDTGPGCGASTKAFTPHRFGKEACVFAGLMPQRFDDGLTTGTWRRCSTPSIASLMANCPSACSEARRCCASCSCACSVLASAWQRASRCWLSCSSCAMCCRNCDACHRTTPGHVSADNRVLNADHVHDALPLCQRLTALVHIHAKL